MRITKEDLLDIITEVSYRIHSELKRAYKSGTLEDYLVSIGMEDLYPREEVIPIYETNPDGKILIIGDSHIKERQICGSLKEFGISKDRIEICLGYEVAKNFSFRSIQYNPNYRLIIFGPVPHSGKGKKDKSSIITQIESDDGYPKVIRLTDENGLKLTKTSLKRAISREIRSGYLAV